jgi:hypothetical protein
VCDAAGAVKVDVPFTNSALCLKEYRGSAGPTPWVSKAYPDEAYLCVMHKVYIGDAGRRYYHRFMTLDKELKPSRVSCFVRFTKERVEYWSGMCESVEKDSVWITYGTKDAEAYIAEIRLTDIESLMMYNLKTGAVQSTVERLATLRAY